ncbi:MAG: ATP-dependent protease [Chloroflexota bacterium]|nr:MAG: ATP-dependent protease [Chloroflexota bacterium]
MPIKSLSSEQLCKRCSPESLNFKTTDEIQSLEKVIGQPRAFKALELGSDVTGKGFNIFVMGAPDSGRTTLSQQYLERKAASQPTPDDWCYVANFKDSRTPKSLRLPAGQSFKLKRNIEQLIKQCLTEIQKTFQGESYETGLHNLIEDLKEKQETIFNQLTQKVRDNDFLLSQTSTGFILLPAVDGKPLANEKLEELSSEQRQELENTQKELKKEVQKALVQINDLELEIEQKIEAFDNQTASFVIKPLVENLKKQYSEIEQVQAHLNAIEEDIINHFDKFQELEETDKPNFKDWFKRYEVNVIVDNSEQEGAPVILESYPSYHNLIGRLEHRLIMGASHTDFTLIRAGALHKANGGYLLIPARDMLINPYAWDSLKRTLRDAQIRILEIGSQAGTISTVSLEPEPIPLNIKIVLFGTPFLYEMMNSNDEDFAKLFKIRAKFATTIDRTPQNEYDYALYVKSAITKNNLPPFDNTAIAKLIEHSSRLARDQEKLSTQLGKITNVISEAAYWAKKENQELVTAVSVKRAIQESIYRNNLEEEYSQEMIAQGTILINTEGTAVGEVNGLSVLSIGEYAFGNPSRVTAASYPGDDGIVNIEREADLSGPTHTKGVLILSGFLGQRYARKNPLSLTASLAFEQSYGGVDGDSASAAELYALLSSIGNIPLRQDRAITGSINQHGTIQAVGGINEKIEGFFQVCQEKGLTGTQGVIIPSSNVRHLMLNDAVVAAVEDEKFHIWPIATFDEGIPLLTDLEAGERDESGTYPDGTFNAKAQEMLIEFAKRVKKFDGED